MPRTHFQLVHLFSYGFHSAAPRASAADGGEHPVLVEGRAAPQRHLLQEPWDFLRKHMAGRESPFRGGFSPPVR